MGKIILNGKEYVTSTTRGFPPLIYSDDEREVGVWRDGKPLYQKSFAGTSSDTTFQISISSLNVDRFVDGQISVVANGGSIKSIVYFANANDMTRIWVNGSNLNVQIGSDYPARPINYVATILYTKTTDTAGSGKYSAVGDLMHHYSTTEQVVGTWINGETIYEKTYEFSSDVTINGNTWYDTPFSTTNMSKIINVSAMNNIGTSWNFFGAGCNEGVIQIIHPRSASLSVRYLIVQYTKISN